MESEVEAKIRRLKRKVTYWQEQLDHYESRLSEAKSILKNVTSELNSLLPSVEIRRH